MRNLFIREFINIRKERGLTTGQAAEMLGISESELIRYESNKSPLSFDFIIKATSFVGKEEFSGLANVFVQGNFGSKIPLVSEGDLINDEDTSVRFYYEVPDVEHYVKDGMFALRYTGADVPELGVLSGCTMIFVNCTSVDRDGVYAVISRDKLRYKKAELIPETNEIRLTPLDGTRRIPKRFKKVSARGRMVCAINTFACENEECAI